MHHDDNVVTQFGWRPQHREQCQFKTKSWWIILQLMSMASVLCCTTNVISCAMQMFLCARTWRLGQLNERKEKTVHFGHRLNPCAREHPFAQLKTVCNVCNQFNAVQSHCRATGLVFHYCNQFSCFCARYLVQFIWFGSKSSWLPLTLTQYWSRWMHKHPFCIGSMRNTNTHARGLSETL